MNNNDDDNQYDVKALQARLIADVQKELADAEAQLQPNRLRAQRDLLLMSLIRARMAQKLSQSQLAVRLGMQSSAISRIESGRGNPTLNTLLMIAKALDVNLVIE